jgi:hypothetical protein
MAWVLTNKNNGAKWNIQKNYFASSVDGKAILALGPPNDTIYAGPFYHTQGPPYLTWNMNKVLASQGKDTVNTFSSLNTIQFTKAPGLMKELVRWTLDKKLANKNKPGPLTTTSYWNWTYDFQRHKLEYYFDTLDCSYKATVDLGHAATDGSQIGATRWAFKGVTAVQNTSQVPVDFALDQNYPNPFNPTTTITYRISSASQVTLKVYDVLGRAIATLVDARVQPGTYQADFDASHLSSGVYLYRLKAGDFTQTMKMVLMK